MHLIRNREHFFKGIFNDSNLIEQIREVIIIISLSDQESNKIKNLWKTIQLYFELKFKGMDEILSVKIASRAYKTDIKDVDMMLDELAYLLIFINK